MRASSQKISIIIPTKDRPQDLARCLESILNQTLLPDEIIIVDASDAQELNSNIIARVNEKAKTIHLHTAAGLTHQKNAGVKASSGDILFFLDDDILPEKDFVKEIVDVFNHDKEGKVAGVGGRIISPEIKARRGRLSVNPVSAAYYLLVRAIHIVFLLGVKGDGKFRASGLGTHPYGASEVKRVENVRGGAGAYRKKIFTEFSFDENLHGYCLMEDADFSYRVSRKYVNIYTPHAKLIHNYSPVARDSRYQIEKMRVENLYYLFKKNLPQTLKHKLTFYWAVIGLCVRGTLQTVVARNMGILKGLLAGLINILMRRNKLRKPRT